MRRTKGSWVRQRIWNKRKVIKNLFKHTICKKESIHFQKEQNCKKSISMSQDLSSVPFKALEEE